MDDETDNKKSKVDDTSDYGEIKKQPLVSQQKGMIFDDEDINIESLDDLIDFCERYFGDRYDIYQLYRLSQPLKELNNLIGMKRLKESIVDLVTYEISNLKTYGEEDFLHTVLVGPPGTGKTTAANILAKIYCELGCIDTANVVHAKRQDFIAGYVGQSEDKTKKMIESAFGGVLFIDEAYSLGAGNRTDCFSKAIIDILNQYLSEHRKDFICIIAGYEKELKENFFSINSGLERRFPWKFKTDKYSIEELREIFLLKLKQNGWFCEEGICKEVMTDDKDYPMAGGSIENLFTCCKFVHARRIFGSEGEKKVLSKEDMVNGLKRYKETIESKEKGLAYPHMYI